MFGCKTLRHCGLIKPKKTRSTTITLQTCIRPRSDRDRQRPHHQHSVGGQDAVIARLWEYGGLGEPEATLSMQDLRGSYDGATVRLTREGMGTIVKHMYVWLLC